ncbi:MAG: radical SAM protein, partial [Candidatus Bathyarchaeia archaeon]
PHVTALPEETLQNSCFDIGVVGEGELTMVELVDKLQSGQSLDNVRGIVYRERGRVRRNPARPYIVDLDSVPFPARHLLSPLDVYRPTPSAHRCLPQATMITSRGCPYNCTFCDRSVFGSAYRTRSARNVVDEMEMLVEKHGAKEIRFWDDTFNIDARRVIQICEEIRARGIDMPWTCLGRVNHMNVEVLRAMAESGCWQVDYGIESGNQRLLDGIAKGITLDMIRTVAKMTGRAGIKMRGFFMLGLPGETEETMRQTIEFAKTLDLSAAVFHITTPFPGTKLYETVLESGELDPKTSWDNYSIFSSEASPYIPKGLSRETIKQYQTEAYRSFYIRLSFILRQVLGIRSLSDIRRYMTGLSVVRHLQ